MKTSSIAALTALLSTGALAVPMAGHNHKAPAHGHLHMRNKRDIIWVTETEIETVVVMKTVFDDGSSPSEPTGAVTTIKPSAPVIPTTSPAAPPASPSETGGSPPPPPAYTPPTTSSAAPVPTSLTSSYVAPPPPSTTQAPAPTSYSPEPAPVPTTYSPEPAPQPSPSPAPAPSQPSGGSGGGETFTGDATYWEPAMGACGWTNTASEDVVAISMAVFDTKTPGGNPNNNPLCGKFVAIKCSDGSTVNAKVVDRCVGCASGDLDMTKTLFDKVTGNGDGRVGGMQWSWA